MNKGLEAFNKLLGSKGISNKEFEIIEKELKAYYELENMHEELAKSYNKLCQEKLEWLKQKKALEIVKKYGYFDNDTGDLIIHIPNGKNEDKEYDLLKEVLL